MSLTILVGGAGSGKSKQLVTEMAERSIQLPNDKFFVIVPEQATLNMQQSVVRHVRGGATMNIDVVSFNRLAQVVFSDLGMDVSNVLDDSGKVLILRQVLEECKEDLKVYKSKVHMPGFSQRIKSAVTELKQYGIGDNELFLMQESAQEKGNGLLFSKLEDLRLITRKFDDKIREDFRASEELLVLFAEHVKEAGRLYGSHIYLDGFTGFTPVQYQLLTELLKTAADVTLTLTVPENEIKDPCPEYDLFHLSNQTLERLFSSSEKAGTEVRVVPARKDVKSGSEGAEKTPDCRIFAAADLKAEVTFAAKEILRIVQEEGFRYRDIAVITSDMESYHTEIEKIFHEAEIPCFVDHKSDITDNPLPRYVMAALSVVDQRFSYESVFTYLKSMLTDLTFEEICKMENYCLEFGIRKAGAWENEMTKNRALYGDSKESEMKWDLDEINRIRLKVMESISQFYHSVSRKNLNTETFVNAILHLLKKNEIERKLEDKAKEMNAAGRLKEAREYEQVYELVLDLLEKTRELSDNEPLSVKEYMNLLESGFLEIKVGVIPPAIDNLMVGDLTRTRLENIKVLFFLGADDGRIPSGTAPTGILSARDREFLKAAHFEIAPTSTENVCNQKFYLYRLFNTPKERLYLTWAVSGTDGEQQGPAYVLDELKELVAGIQVEQIKEMPKIRWKRQALRELAAEFRKDPDEAVLSFFASEDPNLLKKITDAAFLSNAQTPLDSRVALDLYGGVLSGSVSRYEKFSECPFKQFLTYGMRIAKRPEYEIAATDVGTIYHSALEYYSENLKEKGLTFRDVSDEASREIAEESVAQALENMPSDILDSSARNEFFVKRITDVAVKTTDVLRAQVRAGQFEPDQYELEFQDSLGEGVRFKGKIDRVDLYDAKDLFIKIIDYKSGQKEFRVDDIYFGIQLQLVAYLKEAIDVYSGLNPGRRVRPGGVYYYLINDRFVKDEKEAQGKFKLSGLTSCEEGIPEAVDRELGPEGKGSSEIVNMKRKKDGTLSAASQAANDGEFKNLIHFVSGKIEEISRRIREGEIDIHPYYELERKNACTWCDFRNICKFEAGSFGCDWRKKDGITKGEMEAEIYGRVQAE